MRGGRLAGRAESASPILHVQRDPSTDPDLLHAIEVRMRVSAGQNMAVAFSDDEKPDLDRARQQARDYPTEGSTPIVAGEELRTYSFRRPETFSSSEIRHIFLRPTDSPRATFEIESFRLVFRKEHLATFPRAWAGKACRACSARRWSRARPRRCASGHAAATALARSGAGHDRGRAGRRSAWRSGRTASPNDAARAHPHEAASLGGDAAGPGGLRRQAGGAVAVGDAPGRGAIGMWGSPVVRSRTPLRRGRRAPAARPAARRHPVWADTLRRDHLDAYGYARRQHRRSPAWPSRACCSRTASHRRPGRRSSTPSLMTRSIRPRTASRI